MFNTEAVKKYCPFDVAEPCPMFNNIVAVFDAMGMISHTHRTRGKVNHWTVYRITEGKLEICSYTQTSPNKVSDDEAIKRLQEIASGE